MKQSLDKKTAKQQIEEKFHDNYARSTELREINVEENFSLAAQENRHALLTFGQLKGKKILDLGCGFGETAVYWAKKGAIVEAIDISSESIKLAKKLAREYKIEKNCNFRQMTAENLQFKNNYFNFIFGNGVLHHVALIPAIKEIKRVLKENGKAVFIEPLTYNPAINIYRDIAQEVRTPTERPLSFKDISKLRKYFKEVEHQEYELFTLAIFAWLFVISGISPNEERYWRKILQLKGNLKQVQKMLIKLDNIFLKIFPPLRYLCWNTVITITK